MILVGCLFVTLLLLQITDRQMSTASRGRSAPAACDDGGARNLTIDPCDAAHTDALLPELVTARGREDS